MKITKTMIYQSTGLQERKDDIINHLCINFRALMQTWSINLFCLYLWMIIIYNDVLSGDWSSVGISNFCKSVKTFRQ